MKAAPFTHHLPATMAEAAALLALHAPEGGRVLAGGQTLVPIMALRLAAPGHLVDINAIRGLDRISVEGGQLRVGATVRHAAMQEPPIFARIGRHIAHLPIRTRGTVCGSLAYADPASEWCLALATLGGDVVAQSVRGERVIPAADFFRGIMTTALADDEIIVQARFGLPPPDALCGFQEISRRAGDYAMAMALVTLRIQSGTIVQAQIGVGGAEATPRRLPGAEGALLHRPPAAALFQQAADAAAAEIDPITDAQVDAGLRRDYVRAMVRRALDGALASAPDPVHA